MTSSEKSLVSRVAEHLSKPPSYAGAGVTGSILTVAAASYGSSSREDITQPTGFDPEAAALFEAVVEGAFLVANADGHFDEAEKSAFVHVVLAACGGAVREPQVNALVADLQDQLTEDGLDKRIEMVSKTVNKPEQAREVLRVAALIAAVSGGVSSEERVSLGKMCDLFKLDRVALNEALNEVEAVLQS